jgi:hypothetical protein
MAAGKNWLINGNLDIWQRGTSITASTNGQYTADRWQAGSIYGNSVWSQQTTGVPDGSRYCIRVNSSAAGNLMPAQQIVETSNTSQLWGRTVTFSVKLRRNATFGNSLVVSVEKSATVDAAQSSTWTSISSTTIANANLPTGTTSADWVTASVTAAIPADGTANSIKVMIAPNTTVALNGYFEYTQTQLELGSVATAFTRAGGTIQGELAACQRYFQIIAQGNTQYVVNANNWYAFDVRGIYTFPVQMRTAPTLVATTGTNYYRLQYNTTTDDLDSLSIAASTVRNCLLYNDTQAAVTAGTPSLILTNNASASVAISAEL